MERGKPVEKFRAGQVSCALWENEINVNGTVKTVLKASVSRRYKDKDGNWKTAQSFSRNEILLAVYCLEKAFDAIITSETAKSGDRKADEQVA